MSFRNARLTTISSNSASARKTSHRLIFIRLWLKENTCTPTIFLLYRDWRRRYEKPIPMSSSRWAISLLGRSWGLSVFRRYVVPLLLVRLFLVRRLSLRTIRLLFYVLGTKE